MLEKLEYLLGNSNTRPVFVIGSGRSGTHWLGHSLGSHPEVRTTVEAMPMFGLSTRMALDPTLERRLFWRLVMAYKWQILKTAPRLYVDKTHPNMWIAEKLKGAFPRALFIGIERNPYATVASMMKHRGVSAWHGRWREFPIPNRFLGISSRDASGYDSVPLASQCAMRWLAHHRRMNELRSFLGSDLLVISYESFACNTADTISDLQQFLGLHKAIAIPEVKLESLDKWRSQLSDAQIVEVQNVVGFPPQNSIE
jgi:hypothetical protein